MEQLAEPIVGYRYWRLTPDGVLQSPSEQHDWVANEAAIATPKSPLGRTLPINIRLGFFALVWIGGGVFIGLARGTVSWDDWVVGLLIILIGFWGLPIIGWVLGCHHASSELLCTNMPGCGIYAWKEQAKPFGFAPWLGFPRCTQVGGKVALWGEVVIHDKGYRAEKAYPVALETVSCAYCQTMVLWSEVCDNKGFAACVECEVDPTTPNLKRFAQLCDFYKARAQF